MALLDGLLGARMDASVNPFEQYKQMQANPFTRMIPGSEYLSGNSGFGGSLPPLSSGNLPRGESVVPTDFAGVPPGLPNLPEDMQGFGFGQSAPQLNVNAGLRQDLIQQLLAQLLPQLTKNGPFNGGFTGAGLGHGGGSMQGFSNLLGSGAFQDGSF